MGSLKPSIGPREELNLVGHLQQLRDELENALLNAQRQRQELQAIRDRADALLRAMQKQLGEDDDS